MMKKLTIGSMKFDQIQSVPLATQTQTLQVRREAVKETKRMMEIEQDHIHYQVEVKSDQSILEAAFEQSIDIDYKCQKGTCGRCKVKVVNGRSILQPANELEENKLKDLLQMGFRLACQAKAR